MALIDVLLPTCNRLQSLVFTLAGVASQTFRDFRVVLADQSASPAATDPVVSAQLRILTARGVPVDYHQRLAAHGIAEQRDFLLRQGSAPAVLYLDDDVWMEPSVLERMAHALDRQQCGFVGAFPNGASFLNDVRPEQQAVEFWDGDVQPEAVDPDGAQWSRWNLHRAANLYHASARLCASGEYRLYKVAWVASCVLYSRQKLEAVGGFAFWPRLPRYHSGEEVLVQNLLMRRWGGCAIMPSETWHAEIPSTVLNERGSVEGHALDLLPEMLAAMRDSVAR